MSAERSIEAVNEFCSNSPIHTIPLEGDMLEPHLPTFRLAFYPDHHLTILPYQRTTQNVTTLDRLRERVGRSKPDVIFKAMPEMQDSDLRLVNERIAFRAGEPIVVLEWGITTQDEKDYSILYFIPGISPETALAEIEYALTSALPLT